MKNKRILLGMSLVLLLTGCTLKLPLPFGSSNSSSQSSSSSGSNTHTGWTSYNSDTSSQGGNSSSSNSSSSSSQSSSSSSSSSQGGGGSGGGPGDTDYYSGHYYDSLDASLGDGLNGAFRVALTKLIKPGPVPTYGGDTGSYCLSKELQQADEDPNNSNNMIFFYTQESKTKGLANGDAYWNREHVWPQSLSGGHWGKTNAGADMLHLRPTYKDTNNSRGNLLYGEVEGSYLKYNGYDYGKKNSTYFEPTDQVKGDAARIIMYVWTAWNGDCPSSVTNVFQSVELMLRWHLQDLPSEQEAHRNNYVETTQQGNRNPFVDHPEYACKIWGDTNAQTKALCGRS